MAEEVGIEITTEDKTSKGFSSATKNADAFGKKMSDVGGIIKGVGAAIAGFVAARGLFQWFRESTRLASIQQDAVTDFAAALRQAGEDDVAAATAEMERFASSLQSVTTIGDEATIATAAMGVRFGLMGEELQDAVAAATDIATVLKSDVKPVMQAISLAANGNTAALAAFGIKVSESIPESQKFAVALEMINDKFGGAAAAKALTYSGAVTQLGNTFGDLREVVGATTTESKLMRAIIIELSKFISEMTGKLSDASAQLDFMDDGFRALVFAMRIVIQVGGFVVNAFKGLKIVGEAMVLGLIKGFQLFTKVLEKFLTPLDIALEAGVKLGAIDMNPLAAGFKAVNGVAEDLATTFETSIAEGAQSMVEVENKVERAVMALDGFEKSVKAAAAGLKDDLGPAAGTAKGEIDGLNESMATTVSLSDQINSALIRMGDGALDFGAKTDDSASALDRLTAKRVAAIDRATSLSESYATKEAGRLEALSALNARVAQGMANAVGQGFAQMILDSENAAKHMTLAIIDAAQVAVMAYMAAGMSAAVAANAGVPVIGWALGIAGAAAIASLLKGFASQIPEAAMGGVMTGGAPGRDSIGVLVQRDEGILQRGQTKLIQRLVNRLDQAESGGMQSAGAAAAIGGGGTSVINFNSVYPATSAEALRAARGAGKQQQRLRRFGMA